MVCSSLPECGSPTPFYTRLQTVSLFILFICVNYHVFDISLVLQHIRNALAAPQFGVGAGVGHRQISIRWNGNSRFAEPDGDFPAAHALLGHAKNPPHYRAASSSMTILFFSIGRFVAIDWLAADKQTFPH